METALVKAEGQEIINPLDYDLNSDFDRLKGAATFLCLVGEQMRWECGKFLVFIEQHEEREQLEWVLEKGGIDSERQRKYKQCYLAFPSEKSRAAFPWSWHMLLASDGLDPNQRKECLKLGSSDMNYKEFAEKVREYRIERGLQALRGRRLIDSSRSETAIHGEDCAQNDVDDHGQSEASQVTGEGESNDKEMHMRRDNGGTDVLPVALAATSGESDERTGSEEGREDVDSPEVFDQPDDASTGQLDGNTGTLAEKGVWVSDDRFHWLTERSHLFTQFLALFGNGCGCMKTLRDGSQVVCAPFPQFNAIRKKAVALDNPDDD